MCYLLIVKILIVFLMKEIFWCQKRCEAPVCEEMKNFIDKHQTEFHYNNRKYLVESLKWLINALLLVTNWRISAFSSPKNYVEG